MKKFLPYIIFLFITFFFYNPFFLKNLVPIPADIITGVYYPWLDSSYPQYANGVPVKNALPSDVVSLTYPLRLLSINILKSHQWPLWNSQILSGSPLLANFQSAALYPPNLLYFLSSNFSKIWSYQVILQPLLALIFTFLFLRSYQLSSVSSIFGSFVWAFSGFMSIWGQYNTVNHAIIYLPLALFSLKKISDNPYWGGLFSLALAFSFYAGNPPMTLIFLLTSGLYCLFNYRQKIVYYIYPLLFLVLGIGLSAPLLLPGIKTISLSIRQTDNIAADNQIKYLPIVKLATLTTPDLFGNPTTLNHWYQGHYDNLTIFIGVVPLLLFFYSFFIKTKHKNLHHYSITLFFLSLLLMIESPISKFIGNLPLLGLSAMVMTRFSVITHFAIAACSALTIDYLLKHKILPFKKSLISFLIPSIFVYLPLLIFYSIKFYFLNGAKLISNFPDAEYFTDLTSIITNTSISIRNSILPAIFILTLVVVFVIFSKIKLKNNYLLILFLFLVTFFDQYRFFNKYNTFANSDFLYPDTPITDYLKSNSSRFVAEPGEIMPSNMWIPYGLSTPSGYDTLHSSRYNGFISLLNGNSLSDITNRYLEISNLQSPQLDFLGVTHLIVIKRDHGYARPEGTLNYKIDTKKTPVVFENGVVSVLSNPKALPLLYSVPEYYQSTDIQKTNDLLKSIDFSKSVVVESDPGIIPSKISAQVKDLIFTNNLLTANISSTGDSLMVAGISYDPSWKLYIDNISTPINIANYSFISFTVPQGSHNIKLIYHPDNFFLGLKIFLASLVGIILIPLLFRKTFQK